MVNLAKEQRVKPFVPFIQYHETLLLPKILFAVQQKREGGKQRRFENKAPSGAVLHAGDIVWRAARGGAALNYTFRKTS